MPDKNTNIKAKNWYLNLFEKFESSLNGESNSELHSFRKSAIEKFNSIEFPTLKDEEWKYTNIQSLLKGHFEVDQKNSPTPKTQINDYLFGGFDCYSLIFNNGVFDSTKSKINDLPKGVTIGSIAEISKKNPKLIIEELNKKSDEHIFSILNSSFIQDGLFVKLEENVVLDKPIQVLYLSGSENSNILTSPRNIISAGKNSEVKIIINYSGCGKNEYFNNVVNTINCEESSRMELYKIQSETENSFHIDKTDVDQKQGSIFRHFTINFGSSLVRNDLNSILDGENIKCHFYGLNIGDGKQHIDNHTFIDHAKPNCDSSELYKNILQDNSHGVFNGKILVRKDAQKTNAFQSNKTVLLSDRAVIDTKPQLEIYADDVKCSHGATIGQLDEEAYFYIRSRGVRADVAKSMLIHAFANDVIEGVKIKPLQDRINHLIFDHLHRAEI